MSADLAEVERLCAATEAAEAAVLEAQLAGLDARQEQLQQLRASQSDHYQELRTMCGC